MELKWLEDFISLSNSGNFRLSAEQRFVSQPAFSRRIQSLENWVGAELIDRSCQPICMTEAGREFKPVALHIVRTAYQARNEIRAKDSADRQKICFSTLSTLSHSFMPAWLKGLKPYTDISSVSMRSDYMGIDAYLQALESGEVDYFIGYEDSSSALKIDTDKFPSLCIGTERLVPVVSPDANGNPNWWLPDRPQSPIPYLQTNTHKDRNYSLLYWSVNSLINKHYPDLTFVPVYEATATTSIRAMVLEDYGVAWLPLSIIDQDLASGDLVRAAKEEDDIEVDIKIFKYFDASEDKLSKFWQIVQKHGQKKPSSRPLVAGKFYKEVGRK
ncbi:MAG: LysR family transcriptional regulator [Oceanospirillaceae bacterium]|nr:LysR family transcriptional regulator [Oceanospirillaceae bacterium]